MLGTDWPGTRGTSMKPCPAGRFELAEYELGEIDESFTDTLPNATPPREGHPEVLPGLAGTFRAIHLPAMRKALKTRDAAQSTQSFQSMAAGCNNCHVEAGHGFIEVPRVPGQSVPSTEPLSP